MATIRSTRRRLVQGTGATVPFSYGLFTHAGTGRGYGMFYVDTSWNIVQIETSLKNAACIEQTGSYGMCLDPSGQWYYIKSGGLGSSQRSNCFGYIQSTLANMTQRFIQRYSTAVTELAASGTSESYTGGHAILHPAGDLIVNYITAGATSLKCWKKVTNNNWTYFQITPGATITFGDRIAFSPDGTQFGMTRQTGAQPYQIWRVDTYDSATGYTAATCSFSAADQGAGMAFEDASRVVVSQNATPWIRYYSKTASLAWGTDGTILTDNAAGLVGSDMTTQSKSILISADKTVMLCAANSIVTTGKGHHLFYKIAGQWKYQGQLPGNLAGSTTLINDMRFTSDGLFLLVAFQNQGIQVWSVASGSVSFVKRLTIDSGLQNGPSLTATSDHAYVGAYLLGGTDDPAGRSEIDNQIELVTPHFWWKFNEQFDASDADLNPHIRNFGSKKSATGVTGNVMINKTGTTNTATARVSGPPSVTASFAMRTTSGQNNNLTTNGTSYIDDGTSGTIAFFIKFSTSSANWRGLFDDCAARGSNGMHIGLFSGKICWEAGTTGASARNVSTNATFNDGNWHFVVIRQPNDNTGVTISVDGTVQATTVNQAAFGTTGTTNALINHWFGSVSAGAFTMGGDTIAVQFDIAHLFLLTNTLMTVPQETAIKTAAGL